MVTFQNLLSSAYSYLPLIRTLTVVLVTILGFNLLIKVIKNSLLSKARTKTQLSNIQIFSNVLKYLFTTLVVMIAIFSYAGSLTGLGVGLGLFSAALGWALQSPITGIAAWVMIVTRRPFELGDRVIIGDVRGDVYDITLTHVYIKEVGGIVGGEENSGRITMVPNATLFQKNIINYTLKDQYVLDQVTAPITYESNLKKTKKIVKEAANRICDDIKNKRGKEPYIRTYFQKDGINVHVRYFAPHSKLQEYSSKITEQVYDMMRSEDDIKFAYPHLLVSNGERRDPYSTEN